MHFFNRSMQALATHGIHCEKGECLRERHTVRASMQKLYVRIHFAEDRAESNLAECSLRNGSLRNQSRSSGQREALHNPHELLIIDCENYLLLVGHADSRWSRLTGFTKFLGVPRHVKQDYKRRKSGQYYISFLPNRIRPGDAGG